MTATGFGAQSTTDDVLAGIDLAGRTAFVTGGASGIGLETARALAAHGATVIIAARDAAKADAAAATVRGEAGSDTVEGIACDLSSLASVRACAADALERFDRIDLLINNAGVMACPFSRTADGFEMQFGTNHLGHFLLTNLLMPLILKGERQRIVNLSSRGHHRDEVHFDDPDFAHRDYEKWAAYGQSKTANILFTVGLERRLGPRGIHALAVHPGVIMTNLSRHMTPDDMAMMRRMLEQNTPPGAQPESTMKSIPQGAATTCYAATSPDLEGRGGLYCEDCHVAAVRDDDPGGSVKSYAVDAAKAERLWALSEERVGQAFAP